MTSGNTEMELSLTGIKAECRAVQASKGSQAAATWWERNFGHKYIDYVYDVRLERIVKRGNT